jgi:predicted methyltransferase
MSAPYTSVIHIEEEMTMLSIPKFAKCFGLFMAMAVTMTLSTVALAKDKDAALVKAIAGEHRSEKNKARDAFRHPYETLKFFGIKNNMTVVELYPAGGWYAEILAPYLHDKGKYYGSNPTGRDGQPSGYDKALKEMMSAQPKLFDKAITTVLAPGKESIAPAGSADMVLTFRNIHNWKQQGIDKAVFEEAFKALKPGGVLGVVEHRADPNPTGKPGGYVAEADAIALVESAGFKLVEKSEINANPKDTKDYPKGVWTLPPNYSEGDKDREKYTAIGESDRFTLKFVKPKK